MSASEAAAARDTLATLFLSQARARGDRTALRSKRNGVWEPVSWREWEQRARALAAELLAFGLEKGDRVAIFGNTREEWVIADSAVLLAGGVTVPIYQTLIGEQAAYLLADSQAKVLFCEDVSFLERIRAAEAERLGRGEPERALPALSRVVVFDEPKAGGSPAEAGVESYRAVLARGRGADAEARRAVDERIAGITAEDLATIVYTSGTTGLPKGVMLSHGNFVFETAALAGVVELRPSDEQLLFLPLAHIFARILIATQMRIGFATAFAESLAKAMDNAVEVEPTLLGSVPRLYEKIFAVANDKIREEGRIKQDVFAWAVKVGRQMARVRERGEEPDAPLRIQYRYADKLVLSKIRARFGKRLRIAISGGAPLARELAEWFHGCGVLVLEGYGLTETTAATNVNLPRRYRFGTVGPALPGVEVKIASDGEVLVRGPNVMKGYFNREADTREVLDEHGWFHTGDIGVVDRDRFLSITDRKKDLIVTAGGKNVAPQAIENLLKQSPWISQAVVHGDKRPYLVALVTLNAEAMERFARETGRSSDLTVLSKDSEVRARVQLEIDAVNRKLSRFETVKKFAILPRDFTVEGGELTPTLKVKRKVVAERFGALLDALYAGANDAER
jgi:long-chain acyl-CoA synthetase